MAFNYTEITVEALTEGSRQYLGYDLSGGVGMLLNVRLRLTEPGSAITDVKAIENEMFLPGDTVAGFSPSWTTLKDEDLGHGMYRRTRAYQTPGGNVLQHCYTWVVINVFGMIRTISANEHYVVHAGRTLSGTDVVYTPGARQVSSGLSVVSTTDDVSYVGNEAAAWKDVLVAPAGAVLQIAFTAKEGDSLDANLLLSGTNSVGTVFAVDSRITLDGTEIAWARTRFGAFTADNRNLGVRGSATGLAAGAHTLKAQLLIGGNPTSLDVYSGTHRGKLELRRFSS